MSGADHLSLLGVRTKEEFERELFRFSESLGFNFASAMVVVEIHPGKPTFVVVDNAPSSFLEINDLAGAKVDPVMQHCKSRSVPIAWNQATYVDIGLGDRWERQAAFGYRCGIAWALHLPHGRHFVVGLDRDQSLPPSAEEIDRMIGCLQLFATYAQEVAMPLLSGLTIMSETPSLTARELEVLRWTVEGKTAWEISRILSIAENTVVRHGYNASTKLNCSGRHQAAVRAFRLGLIS